MAYTWVRGRRDTQRPVTGSTSRREDCVTTTVRRLPVEAGRRGEGFITSIDAIGSPWSLPRFARSVRCCCLVTPVPTLNSTPVASAFLLISAARSLLLPVRNSLYLPCTFTVRPVGSSVRNPHASMVW